MNLYEGMFILDNEAVRADWKGAKALVTDTLTKHGAEVVGARRWDERKLAYPIKRRKRGTYLLAYYNIDSDRIEGLRRDLELSESVLRYVLLRTEEVPVDEAEKCRAEDAEGYVPPPPPDEEEPVEPEPEPEPRPRAKRDTAEGGEGGEASSGAADETDESGAAGAVEKVEKAEMAEVAEKKEEA